MIESGRFFVPGPTEVRPELLDVMRRPMIFHRTREMEDLLARVTPRLSRMFGTRRPVHVVSGSGTAAMELAIRSGSARTVLSVVHGDFGERFARMAEACGRTVTRLAAEPGDVVPLDRIRDALRRGHFDTITATHSETSTGTLGDIGGIAAIANDFPDCLVLVDAVSSVGAVAVEMDDWGVDAVVSASQKAMALPPGLAFAAVSDRLLERARTLDGRGIYLDVLRYEEFAAKHQSPTTPAVSLLFALDAQLVEIEREGLAARFERHRAMASCCAAWAERATAAAMDIAIVARAEHRSPSVTAIRSRNPRALIERMREQGYVIGGGQAPVAKSTFRIGHMGDHTVAGVEGLLEVLERVMRAS